MSEPAECKHNGIHQHGMHTMYQRDACRCDPCRKSHRDALGHRRRQIAYGRHKGFQPVGPVQEHIRLLRSRGINPAKIYELSGVSHTAQYLIMTRTKPNGKVLWRTASSILAIDPDQVAPNPMAPIDGTGTARRIQALIAIGWSQRQLYKQMGVGINTIVRALKGERVSVEVARKVADYYDRMWDKPAPPSVSRSLALHSAAVHGYVSALAWDDDEIDDPKAKPHGAWRATA